MLKANAMIALVNGMKSLTEEHTDTSDDPDNWITVPVCYVYPGMAWIMVKQDNGKLDKGNGH